MSSPTPARVLLVDQPEEPGRTTATLLASLAARLATLHFVNGATAVGSLVAGFAALGREVSQTATGARLRRAIESGRAAVNGQAVWSALRISEGFAALPPSPVLDHLRNDLALLLAGDLPETIELLPIPGHPAGAGAAGAAESVEFLDCIMGLWAFSVELVAAVEALAAPTLEEAGTVAPSAESPDELSGPLLR